MEDRSIIILSICIAETSLYYEFHFKGVYKGNIIKKLMIEKSSSVFDRDHVYKIKARVKSIESQIMYLSIIDYRFIDI